MEITFHDLPKGVGEDERRTLCALVGLAAIARHHRLSGLNTDLYFSQFLKLQDQSVSMAGMLVKALSL